MATSTVEAGGQGTVVPPIPKELIESIQNGECVLFAGSGLSAQAGLPTWTQFLMGLLDFARERKILDPSTAQAYTESLEQGETNAVADGIIFAFGSARDELQEFLLKTFPETTSLPPVYEFLKQIPFASVVTNNYDTLLERALPQFADAGVYTPRDAEALLDAQSQQRKYILKLNGLIRRPDTLIFAPVEYRDVVLSNLPFSKFVEGLFVSRTFFFVGLSLEGIQDFLSAFSFRGSTQPRKHFALVPVSGSAWKPKADLLERRFNVNIIGYPLSESHRELESFVEQLASRFSSPAQYSSEAESSATKLPGIRKVILEDIGTFERLELTFGSDHWKILLGDNGVGKSTILKAIATAIIGSDARANAGRLVRSGKTRGRITIETDRNPSGYITEILTKDLLSDCEVISLPTRLLEAEGFLAVGFSPLRSVSWKPSEGPQPISSKGRPTADDLIPLLSGEVDGRMDRLKQWVINLDSSNRPLQSNFRGHEDRVSGLAFSRDGRTLISGSIDKTVRIWDLMTGQQRQVSIGHTGGVNAVAISGDGRIIASGSYDTTIKRWDAAGKLLNTLQAGKTQILSVTLNGNGNVLVAGSESGSIRVWDLTKKDAGKRISSDKSSVWSIAVNENGTRAVAGREDGSIQIFDLTNERKASTSLKTSGESIWSIALTPDGRRLASGDAEGNVSVWDLETGNNIKSLRAQGSGTLSVAISTYGETVAAGFEDGTACAWDCESGRELISSQAGKRGVWSIALSPDGRTLATGSDDRLIRLQSVPGSISPTQQQETIFALFDVIAGLTDRPDIKFLRVENNRVFVKTAEAPSGIPLESLSQGLTSLLGWVGCLCERLKETYPDVGTRPLPTDSYALVLLDEIDAHMHPRWQQVLVSRLKDTFPNIQFIVTTHSPLIVAGMEHHEIVRLERDFSGKTAKIPLREGMALGSADQLLTGALFNLESAQDATTLATLERYTELAVKDILDPQERAELEEKARRLQLAAPSDHERDLSKEAYEVLKQAIEERLKGLPESERSRMQTEIKAQIQEGITGSRRRP